MTSEVDGMMSATRSMKTVMARRLVITNVMRSPDSGGRQNAVTVKTKMEKAQCKKCLCQRIAKFYYYSIFFLSFSLAEIPPRDLQITAYK